ncbi:DUF5686 family protein [Flavobacterium crassostreae]|uniref:Carboxypeptidase-like regulatory domain-containing protein n=1 Tax=Flavobacterium crassostreae TaxID=1763534 RepID=A0A1B9E5Y4_9FLAO|nr:DUF5686 family protein [Flavobacterium crassostreae]OCB77372.1 hypothetical protein LPBF_05135 [Flavobacterium crassostreae]
MKQLCVWFFLLTLSMQAQFHISGTVRASATNMPLGYATITSAQGNHSVTDVDGRFDLVTKTPLTNLKISYLGYYTTSVTLTPETSYYTIYLDPKQSQSNAVLLAQTNPEIAIIQQTIANKPHNNPQKKLSSFEFTSYNKLIVSAPADSISSKIDSIFVDRAYGKKFSKLDSTNYKIKEMVSEHHLFQTEKVSRYQFANHTLKETILGTKMAGFKQPIYEILAFNLQSFSIYDSSYELFETKYNSPIADNAFKDYTYKILDTVAIGNRDSFMILFKNKKKSRTTGLEGVLYIDTKSFAITKAIMRIKGVIDISGTHEFDYIASEDLWFPIQKSFRIVKGQNDDDIKILGGTIQFDGDTPENFGTRKRAASDYSYLHSESSNFDITYNTPIPLKNIFIAVKLDPKALHQPEQFWEKYRKDSLDLRSQKTYLALDSIAIKKKIASRLRFGRKVINGYVPLRFLDMDLRKIVSYNNYEGFRLGFGGITNEQFSRYIQINGHVAYGTKDDTFKYNLGLATLLNRKSNSWIGIAYTDDVKEIASTVYAIEKKPFKLYDPRPINISTFYNYVGWSGSFETKLLPKTESALVVSSIEVSPLFKYLFKYNGTLYSKYTLTTAMLSMQWSPFSTYMQTPDGRIESEKRFPKFTFQFTKSLPNIAPDAFDFSKIEFKAEHEKKHLNGHKTNLLVEAGFASGAIPLTHLYNNSPNNITKKTIIQRITFASKNSFETMYFNEFFSSEYIYFQFKHSFNRVKIIPKVKPSLVLVSRMGWGDMQKPQQHIGLDYKNLTDGFFESGIELNQLFNGLGLTAFYRYGPNQLPKLEDNIAVKLSFVLKLGL